MRSIVIIGIALSAIACSEKAPQYGVERRLFLPGREAQVWAVAPAVNLSGVAGVDPLLQADIVYQQLQTVHGIKAIPVNRVAEVYAALDLGGIENDEQAAAVCELLAADGLVVVTVTSYDPYNPPKLGASLQLFRGPREPGGSAADQVKPRDLTRMPSEAPPAGALPRRPALLQSVGMYDAADGSVREKLMIFADGRNDPQGPLGAREYLLSMDRYCGFVYHDLVEQLLLKLERTESR
jgi:hypothetical protein